MTETISPADREVLIAGAQASRDRARLAAISGESLALRRRVEQIERSLQYRALSPLRRITEAVLGQAAPSLDVDFAGRGKVLVIEHHWPRPDRDAGSLEIVLMVECLARLGFTTVLAASKEHDGAQPGRDALQARGLTCLQPEDAPSVSAYIAAHGGSIDLAVLCRVFCGGEFLEEVERHCPKARIIYNSIDLNYLREERKAQLLGDETLRSAIQQARLREEHVIRRADATLVVSDAEAALLAAAQPDCFVVHMPLSRAVRPPVAPFWERSGIGFIGGFLHSPNLDGIQYFLAEVWPLVRRDLPGCEMTIVGADAPAGLLNGAEGPIQLLGHLPDIAPWFEGLRLTVAPLRFGAGAKGKVASSLAAGVPCVATPLAAEGMALDDAGVVVSASASDFAAAICRVHEDEALWTHLSQCAVHYAQQKLSPDAWQIRFDAALRRLGL